MLFELAEEKIMGSWSATILGGDEPQDQIYDLARKFGGMSDDWNSWEAYPDTLKAGLEGTGEDALLEFIKTAYEPSIAAQCVAYASMAVGASLPNKLRQQAIDACKNENTESWNDPGERRSYLDQFAVMVSEYDNMTAQKPPEKGLWDAIGEHMSKGTDGLLNDNIGRKSKSTDKVIPIVPQTLLQRIKKLFSFDVVN